MATNRELDPRIEKIASGIRQLRIDAGYSAAENFAYDNEIPRVQYWRLETGANLTITSLLRILDIHRVSLKEFAERNGL